jgi:hypothetical protein
MGLAADWLPLLTFFSDDIFSTSFSPLENHVIQSRDQMTWLGGGRDGSPMHERYSLFGFKLRRLEIRITAAKPTCTGPGP